MAAKRATKAQGLYDVIRCVRPAHRYLHRAVEQQLKDSGVTVGMRAVLERLADHGARTAPELARDLDIPRQFAQRSINSLIGQDMAERLNNPAHKRSYLIRITAKGRQTFERIKADEHTSLKQLAQALSADDIAAAQRVMRALVDFYGPEQDINP